MMQLEQVIFFDGSRLQVESKLGMSAISQRGVKRGFKVGSGSLVL